jgi:hypothetical protein
VPGGHVRLTSFRRNGIAHPAWFAMDSAGTVTMHTSRRLAAAAITPRSVTPPGTAYKDPSSLSGLPVCDIPPGDERADHRPRPPRPSSYRPVPSATPLPAPGILAEDERADRRQQLPDRPPSIAVAPADLLAWDLLSSDDPADCALTHHDPTSRNSKTRIWCGGLAVVLFGVANALIPFSNPSAEQVALPGNNLMALAAYSSVLDGWKKTHPPHGDNQPSVFE